MHPRSGCHSALSTQRRVIDVEARHPTPARFRTPAVCHGKRPPQTLPDSFVCARPLVCALATTLESHTGRVVATKKVLYQAEGACAGIGGIGRLPQCDAVAEHHAEVGGGDDGSEERVDAHAG